MLRSIVLPLLITAVFVVGGCDMLDPAGEVDTARYVVESYQIAGEPFGTVLLRETTDLNTHFQSSKTGISGAEVLIKQVADDGSVDTTVNFTEDAGEAGLYRPDGGAVVEPMTRYRLEIAPPGNEEPITSETITPDTFSVSGPSAGAVTYRTGDHLAIPTSASRYPDRQSIYLLDLQALDAREEQLTPTAKQLMRGVDTELDSGDGYTLKDMRRTEWGPINETTYRSESSEEITVTVAWDKVAFFGPNRIDTYVIDDNLYEIIRSDAAQSNSARPGEIPPVVDHVTGGTGVFAGMARARYEVVVEGR